MKTSRISSVTPLHLVPISEYSNDFTFLSEPDDVRRCLDKQGRFVDDPSFVLCLVEENDLPDLSRFVVSAFGAEAIRLSQDLNAIERLIMSPAAELLNSYSGIVAFAEVLSGTRQRCEDRLKRMDMMAPKVKGLERKEMIDVAARDSLVLALAKPHEGNDRRLDIIASIELRLQVRD